MIQATFVWLNDPLNWRGTLGNPGIGAQIVNHLWYSALALLLGSAVAVPLGLLLGHTGRGTWLVTAANSLRALPTVGLLILFYVMLAPHITGRGNAVYLIPTEAVLVLLAVPPILANTFAGVQNVGPEIRDAARGMGMTGPQVLSRVELPNALPLMFSGMRAATLQVVATATVAAYVGLGGLGRFVFDGLSQRDFPKMTGGAVLVALTALVTDVGWAIVQRLTVSPGLAHSSRRVNRIARRRVPDARVGQLDRLEAPLG